MVEGQVLEDHRKWQDLKPYTIREIGYGEYAKLKGQAASMLSYEQPRTFRDIFPPFTMPEEGVETMNVSQESLYTPSLPHSFRW